LFYTRILGRLTVWSGRWAIEEIYRELIRERSSVDRGSVIVWNVVEAQACRLDRIVRQDEKKSSSFLYRSGKRVETLHVGFFIF